MKITSEHEGMAFSDLRLHKLASQSDPDEIMIDATHLKAHRTASSLPKGGGCSPPYWANKGWAELEIACGLRRAWTPHSPAAEPSFSDAGHRRPPSV